MQKLGNCRFSAGLTVSVVLSWCICTSHAAGADDKNKPADGPKEIRKVLDDQVGAWNKGDLVGFMAGYAKSPELTFYSGKDKRLGWDETLERYKMRYQSEGKEMGTLEFAELEIKLLGGDDAVVKGRWKLQLKKDSPDGLFTLIMHKTDQGWKIVHDHTSG